MTEEFRWFRYVCHASVPAYEALGWIVLEPAVIVHHDDYACVMEWHGTGSPPMPESTNDTAQFDHR